MKARERAREVKRQEKAIRREERDLFRKGKMTATENDSLALLNIPPELHEVWEQNRHLFNYDCPPDHRAEMFLEWVEEHPTEVIGDMADRADAIDWAARERAYYEDEDDEVPF